MGEDNKQLNVSLMSFLYAIRDYFEKKNVPFFYLLACQAIEAVEDMQREQRNVSDLSFQLNQLKSDYEFRKGVQDTVNENCDSIANWFCKNSNSIVFEFLWWAKDNAKAQLPDSWSGSISALLEKSEHYQDTKLLGFYLMRGNKIGTIKCLRSFTGWDLVTAKNAVEAFFEQAKQVALLDGK